MTSRVIGNNRLLKLAEILDQVPQGMYDQQHAPSPEEIDCGTPACAGGWWEHSRQAKRLRARGFLSWREAFDLGSDEVTAIFSARGCDGARTGKQAAKYIRQFVAQRQKDSSQ